MNKTAAGFTLIELLIAVAIVGIIASVAYPSYSESIIASKRKEAEAALVSLANAMEMWKMQHGYSYLGAGPAGADTGAPSIFSVQVPIEGGTKTYDLTISAATATTYTLSAVPVKSDPACGTLTLTNTGVKAPATAGCW